MQKEGEGKVKICLFLFHAHIHIQNTSLLSVGGVLVSNKNHLFFFTPKMQNALAVEFYFLLNGTKVV